MEKSNRTITRNRKNPTKNRRRKGIPLLASPYALLCIPVTWSTTYSATGGAALAQTLSFTTANVFASYSSFTVQITNLYQEYRIAKLKYRIFPVPGVSNAGLYPSGLHMAPFEGPTTPALTIAALSRLPGYRIVCLSDREASITWNATNDPEDLTFTETSVACPIIGGLCAYVGASAPASTVTYMVVVSTAYIVVRGRKI